MKVIVFILSLFLLISCSPENLWQKAGVVAPKPMTISPKTGGAEEKEGKVDVVRSFIGDRNSSIAFSIDKPDAFNGSVLYPQSKEEAEAMAQTLNAKCFSQEKIKEFLSTSIEDEE